MKGSLFLIILFIIVAFISGFYVGVERTNSREFADKQLIKENERLREEAKGYLNVYKSLLDDRVSEDVKLEEDKHELINKIIDDKISKEDLIIAIYQINKTNDE